MPRMKRSLPVVLLLAFGMLAAARTTFTVRSASPTPSPLPASSRVGVHLSVLPQTVGRGDVVTVIADSLPGPADQFCVYEGTYPLAHFVPPGYGEQISPLLPDGQRGEGIGAYQTMLGVSGSLTLSVASCRYGLAPRSVTPVASVALHVQDQGLSAPPLGLRVIGNTPLGTPFTVTPEPHHGPTCLFVVPDVVLPGLRAIPGVRVPTGARSATLTVPSTYPWGVYQIFQTKASTGRTCPRRQLQGNAILMGAGWTFGRWRLRMESEGQPTAGSGLAIRLDLLYDPKPLPICVAAWTSGRYTGLARTYGATAVGGGATVRFPLPRSLVGTVTITGTRGTCPTGPPHHFDAFTPVVITSLVEPSPTATSLSTPVGPTSPAPLPACPAMPAPGRPPSPTGGDSRLAYSTYLGQGAVQSTAVALDRQGNAFVALSVAGGQEGCVVELSRDGSKIVRSAMIPGTIEAMVFDRAGNLWLTGSTSSHNFPLVRPVQPAVAINPAFVAELNPTNKLIFSTELGGRMGADAQAIAVDGRGSVYVIGQTDSTDFPTTRGALQRRSGSIVPCPANPCPNTVSSSDAFVTKFSAQGKIVYSTYLGRNENEDGQGIAVDAEGDAYVSGWTASNDFPNVHPLPHSHCPGPFLAELSPEGAQLLASTCLGAHFTLGLSGPLTVVGPDIVMAGSSGVMKLDPAQRRTVWWLPFNHGIAQVNSLVVDKRGTIYLTGSTASATFPLLHPIQQHLHPATCGQEDASHYCTDAFVAAVSAAGKLLFSTYLGGGADDAGQGISVEAGRIAVTGFTASEDFPVRLALQSGNEGEADQYHGGKTDGFVTVLSVPVVAMRQR